MSGLIQILDKFMTNLLLPIGFMVTFVTLVKIIRTLQSHTDLLMYYGKQIEDIRKIVAGMGNTRRPDIKKEDTGLYEVLNE